MSANDIQYSKSNNIRDLINATGEGSYKVDKTHLCSFCGNPLLRTEFNPKKDRFACNHVGCGLYGTHQGCELR